MLNSRHPLVTATPKWLAVLQVHHSGHTFFRSYGVNLPSSFWIVLSHALGYSPHPLVSVYGTVACTLSLGLFLEAWNQPCAFDTRRYLVALITLKHIAARLCQMTPTRPAYRLELPSIRQLTYPSPSPRTANCAWRCRNINLLPITYAFRHRLRGRLTLRGISLLEETLGLRRPGFSPGLSLLMSA